jgi:exodeoxyribonuclease V alpha subunit
MVFLRAHGLGQALATRIVKRYGKGAVALIQANPYRLADDVIGIGFRTADQLAHEIGIAPASPDRIQAGILFQLSQAARNGHCYLPRLELMESTAELLTLGSQQIDDQLQPLALQGRIRIEATLSDRNPGRRELVFPTTLHLAETGVARCIHTLLHQHHRPLKIDVEASLLRFEANSGMELPAGQRTAVQRALTHPVSVITGGPGVGKTTIIRALAEILGLHDRNLVLCAPTGRAAKRLEESTGRAARTIHRLLDWQVGSSRFLRDAEQPLEGDVLVVDEASMLDIQLAYNLLRAIPANMALVLVGDVDQLPSVGPGQVLADIIAAETVPVTRLTAIFRQREASLIVENAHALLQGQTPRSAPRDDGDFFYIESRDSQHTRELVLELVSRRIPRRFGLDPIREVQVLTPMYRGHAGADTINADLQERLNPGGEAIIRGGRTFRVGDKVMQIRNDYDLDLFNGDTGRIRSVDRSASTLRVGFGEREIEYPFAELDAMVIAYAISVHRAQGSEYPAVVIPLATDHYMMLRRNLLYTAITRGRQLVVLVGVEKALRMAVRNDQEAHRYSGLADRLRACARDP